MKPVRAGVDFHVALTRQLDKAAIALISPSAPLSAASLMHILGTDGRRLLYYRAPARSATIAQWAESLLSLLAAEGFIPDHIPRAGGADAAALGAQLAAALKTASVLIFCDNFDQVAWTRDAVAFFDAFLASAQGASRLIVCGRVLIMAYWKRHIASGAAALVSANHADSPALATPDQVTLEVYGFGRGRVVVNGADVTAWDGVLPRYLFHFFVDRVMVRRDAIFQEFWPGLKPRDATNVFHVTKRKIAECLSVRELGVEVREFTRYESGFYMPAESISLVYDVARFQYAYGQGSGSRDAAESEAWLSEAVSLYRGDFLEGVQDVSWVVLRREELREAAIDAYTTLIDLARTAGRFEDAIGYGVRALLMAPDEINLHRLMIELYSALQRPEDAARQIELMERLILRGQGAEG
jgi:DNA-binding SARP family transcriptional activator